MQPDGERKGEAPADVQEDIPVAGNRLLLSLKQFLKALGRPFLRPKHFLQAGAVKLIDGCTGLLQRLRNRVAESDAGGGDERSAAREESHAKSKPREDHGKEAAPKQVAAPPPRRAVQGVLLYLLVLIVGGLAGMTFSFVLFSTMVSNQAQKIDNQRDDISQLEKQHSILMESEARARKESNEYRKQLSDIDARETARHTEAEKQLRETAANSGAPPGAKQVANKAGNCKLDGGTGDSKLPRCVEEFNRR